MNQEDRDTDENIIQRALTFAMEDYIVWMFHLVPDKMEALRKKSIIRYCNRH